MKLMNNEQLFLQFASCAGIDCGTHAEATLPSIVRRSKLEKINRPSIPSYLATTKPAPLVHFVTAFSKKKKKNLKKVHPLPDVRQQVSFIN